MENNKPVAVIMIGIPGSGKSTDAAQMLEIYPFEVLSADLIREELYGDAGIQGDAAKVWGKFDIRLRDLVRFKKNIIIDNTSTRAKDRKKLLQTLKGYDVTYRVWLTPVKVCLERNKKRERKVPEDVILRMANTLNNNLSELAGEVDKIVYFNIEENIVFSTYLPEGFVYEA